MFTFVTKYNLTIIEIMKKLFFLLFTVTALFSSCSSDDDNFAQAEPSPVAQTYPVDLNIRSSVFNIDKTPLTKSASFGDARFLQVIVYKESGEVYSDSVIYKENLQTLIQGDSAVSFKLDLPEGNYNLAIFSIGKRYGVHNNEISIKYPIGPINPNNYETDKYELPHTSISGYYQNNTGLYYYTSSLSVSAEGNNSLDNVVLEPMWSDITVTLKDLKLEKIPSGTTNISVTPRPGYLDGFYIKSKLALNKSDSGFFMANGTFGTPYGIFQVIYYTEDINNEITLNFVSAKGEDTDMSILVEYVTSNDILQDWVVIGSQEFKLSNKFENGKSYNISGRLNVSTGDSNLNLQVTELNPNEIEIPFE